MIFGIIAGAGETVCAPFSPTSRLDAQGDNEEDKNDESNDADDDSDDDTRAESRRMIFHVRICGERFRR